MDYSTIKQIQEVEYEALKAFVNLCKENNIYYYLRGGSVLGAIKYNGFIPWDDDLDVAIPRPDYERLINIVNGEVIDGKFIINSYKYNKDMHCYFPRMVLSEDERIKRGLPQNTQFGLHIMDIFPLDGAPNNIFSREIYFIKVYILRALASIGTIYDGEMVNMHTNLQQNVINFLRFLKIDMLVEQRNIYEILDKLYTHNSYKNLLYAGTITASLFEREIFPKDVWGNGEMVYFRELEVRVPSLYDTYLQKLYGKRYMVEEPDDEHKKQHTR